MFRNYHFILADYVKINSRKFDKNLIVPTKTTLKLQDGHRKQNAGKMRMRLITFWEMTFAGR
jgi:hypothetical protein